MRRLGRMFGKPLRPLWGVHQQVFFRFLCFSYGVHQHLFMIIINFVINAVLINLVFISIIISDHCPDNSPAPGVTSACVSPDIYFLRAAASEDHDDDHHVCSCSRP